MCACCGTGGTATRQEEEKRNAEINMLLREARKEMSNEVKLLLVGA